jgi:hypothetical protein
MAFLSAPRHHFLDAVHDLCAFSSFFPVMLKPGSVFFVVPGS